MDKIVLIVGFLIFIVFIYTTINSSVLHNVNPECNKELVESKKYKFSYYSSGLFALAILAGVGYLSYSKYNGNTLNFMGNTNDLMKVLETDSTFNPHVIK